MLDGEDDNVFMQVDLTKTHNERYKMHFIGKVKLCLLSTIFLGFKHTKKSKVKIATFFNIDNYN